MPPPRLHEFSLCSPRSPAWPLRLPDSALSAAVYFGRSWVVQVIRDRRLAHPGWRRWHPDRRAAVCSLVPVRTSFKLADRLRCDSEPQRQRRVDEGPHVVGAHVYGWAGYSGQTPNGADGPVNRCGMSFGRYWYSNSSPAHACLPRAYSVWTAQSVSTRSLVRISQERLHPQAVASHLGNSRAWVPDELACKSQQRPQPAARCRRTPHMRFTKA